MKHTHSIFKRLLPFLLVLCLLVFVGCGAAADGRAAISQEAVPADVSGWTSYSKTDSLSDAPKEESVTSSRKIIETVRMTVQTKGYDAFLSALNEKIQAVGGYIESSRENNVNWKQEGNRSSVLTVRIPQAKSNEFAAFIGDSAAVTNKEITTDDVTLQYVDTESRVKALESEKAALEALMNKAETMSDVLAIRDQLTKVIYEIESAKSQLRVYDNLVSFSTYTLNVYEVEREEVVEKQGVFAEIGTNLANNFSDLGHFFVRLFVFLISALPYLLLLGAIALFIVWICKRSARKRRERRIRENAQHQGQ